MRFDDSLRTVLAADSATPFGAASAWRQLVDLVGRGRAGPGDEALARLRTIRADVPDPVRAASARALAGATPGAALVALFAEDAAEIAAPVLRAARLSTGEWVAILPLLSPANRAVLRHRRDLSAEVGRALDAYRPVDFVLASAVVADVTTPTARADTVPEGNGNGFPISDLVARIEAFQREREAEPVHHLPDPDLPWTAPVRHFSFETDANGAIDWVDGAPRAPLVGLSVAHAADGPGGSGVDAAVAGAFARRSRAGGRFVLGGASAVAGEWRIVGEPLFEPASGRFTGYRCEARRPRADERAGQPAGTDGLRQLMHELRTPATAIAGFAELIEREMLGAVADPYRCRAGQIREQAADLVAAIDDLDASARLEAGSLDLWPGHVPLAPLLTEAVAELAGLALARGAALSLVPVPAMLALAADERAARRIVTRLLAALLSAAGQGERLTAVAMRDAGGQAVLLIDRPLALQALGTAQLLSLDAEAEAARPGAPLLGTGFSLRLVQGLAAELGGALTIGARRLTLRLPAAVSDRMDMASTR